MLRFIGLDIGTTTISAVVIDGTNGKVLKSVTEKNDAAVNDEFAAHRMQDPKVILDKIIHIKHELVREFSPISAIGITGQMHGILYLDEELKPVSPLYTWQDTSGQLPYKESTYAQYLSKKTGYSLASGYGIVTHYVNQNTDNIPEKAALICTIHDYIACALTNKKPIMHSSDAASLGCFVLEENRFDCDKLKSAGIDTRFLPKVTSQTAILGKDNNGIPVTVAIGDNQASVLGALRGSNCALINIGTGSQVSVPAPITSAFEGGEIRPLYENNFMLVGAPLCGGRSFALLHRFFKECARLFGGDTENIYSVMDSIAEDEIDKHSLTVDTRFCGTRKDPQLRGAISGISEENFTPHELTRGFLYGMAQELYSLYEPMIAASGRKITSLVGSGNAIRKSPVLRRYMRDIFGIEPVCPIHREEAAFGAALFASVASETYANIAEAQDKLVHFEGEI